MIPDWARSVGEAVLALALLASTWKLKKSKSRLVEARASDMNVSTMQRVIDTLVAQNARQEQAIASLQKAHESCEENHQKLTAEVESLKAHVARLEAKKKEEGDDGILARP